MLGLWSTLARVCGGGAILFGLFAGSHAPTDIQLGIVTTSLIGGAILCFIGVGLVELNKLQVNQRELMHILTRAAATRPTSLPPMTAGEREAYDRHLGAVTPIRFDG